MKPAQVEKVLLLRDVEQELRVISPELSAKASFLAGITEESAPAKKTTTKVAKALFERARYLEELLQQEGNKDRENLWGDSGVSPKFGTALLLLSVLCFALGLGIDRLGGTRFLNVLAPPFIGVLLWNFLVYMASLGRAVFTKSSLQGGVSTSFFQAFLSKVSRVGRVEKNLAESQSDSVNFLHRDSRQRINSMYRPSSSLYCSALLHILAACLALGMIAGMYFRGLSKEYTAVWESTFLDEPQAAKVIEAMYFPATKLSPLSIEENEIAEMKVGADTQQESRVSAAKWIHLGAITLAIFVIIPRLLFALLAWMRGRQLWKRQVKSLGLENYYNSLLPAETTQLKNITLLPYCAEVNSEIQEHLPMVISEYWGDAAATQYLAQLQYGEEDRLIERLAGEGVDSDRYILFSSVNSTAEKETHGLLLEALKKQLPPVSAGGQGKPSVLVLLNISDFDERFANLAEYQDKLSAKVASWEKLIPEQVAVALWNPQKDSRKDFRDRLQSMNLAGEAQGV